MSIEYNKVYEGTISEFGGPKDEGVKPDEGLAIYNRYEENPSLFLPHQPSGTTGLARRLNPNVYYCACRWDYSLTPKIDLKESLVQITFGKRTVTASPADWGPNEKTKRLIDASPAVLKALKCQTDDTVKIMLFRSVVV